MKTNFNSSDFGGANVYGKKLLYGPAKQFIKLKRNTYSWTDFKREMTKEFHVE